MLTITTPIEVTAAHLLRGVPGEPCDCPVWRAIVARLPHLNGRLFVRSATIRIDDSYFDLPQRARDGIRSVDRDEKVQPFGFALDLPDYLALPPAEVSAR
jgi:hypothetical protein